MVSVSFRGNVVLEIRLSEGFLIEAVDLQLAVNRPYVNTATLSGEVYSPSTCFELIGQILLFSFTNPLVKR